MTDKEREIVSYLAYAAKSIPKFYEMEDDARKALGGMESLILSLLKDETNQSPR